jgi:predicted MPP superfamily phosphohydrolase
MKLPLKKFIYALLGVAILGLAVYAFLIEPNALNVNRRELRIRNWSPKLNGFKIVAISDLHAGSNFITAEKIREVVARANAEEADLVVLLGDYVSRRYFARKELKMPVEVISDNLRGLKAKYGVYAVLGNHDNEYDDQSVRTEMERTGLKILENEVVSLERNGEKLRILGVRDILKLGSNWAQVSDDLKKYLENASAADGKLIVLTHNPDTIVYLTEGLSISNNLALILAGHTHGGQVRFPLVGSPIVPSEFGQKYAAGHIRDKGVDMFVTTGIGTSILPVRFGVPPEIAVLEIYAE